MIFQLNSYGGYIRYIFRYSAPFVPKLPRIADVILKGNGITLYHVLKQPFAAERDNNVEIRLWEVSSFAFLLTYMTSVFDTACP